MQVEKRAENWAPSNLLQEDHSKSQLQMHTKEIWWAEAAWENGSKINSLNVGSLSCHTNNVLGKLRMEKWVWLLLRVYMAPRVKTK